MSDKNFSTSFPVSQSPEVVFDAINNVRGWWSEAIEGSTDNLGAVFNYHYQDIHRCTFEITEFSPGTKIVWHCVDNYFNFIKDKNEWTGTKIIFEISEKDNKTQLRFTHVGLVNGIECYDACSNAWSQLIQESLFSLITTGKGKKIF